MSKEYKINSPLEMWLFERVKLIHTRPAVLLSPWRFERSSMEFWQAHELVEHDVAAGPRREGARVPQGTNWCLYGHQLCCRSSLRLWIGNVCRPKATLCACVPPEICSCKSGNDLTIGHGASSNPLSSKLSISAKNTIHIHSDVVDR